VPNATSTAITLTCADSDGDALTLSIVAPSGHGTLGAINQASKSVTYSPTGTYSGNDTFSFKANDGKHAGPLLAFAPTSLGIRVRRGPGTGVATTGLTDGRP
jgi:hypothetical protein